MAILKIICSSENTKHILEKNNKVKGKTMNINFFTKSAGALTVAMVKEGEDYAKFIFKGLSQSDVSEMEAAGKVLAEKNLAPDCVKLSETVAKKVPRNMYDDTRYFVGMDEFSIKLKLEEYLNSLGRDVLRNTEVDDNTIRMLRNGEAVLLAQLKQKGLYAYDSDGNLFSGKALNLRPAGPFSDSPNEIKFAIFDKGLPRLRTDIEGKEVVEVLPNGYKIEKQYRHNSYDVFIYDPFRSHEIPVKSFYRVMYHRQDPSFLKRLKDYVADSLLVKLGYIKL